MTPKLVMVCWEDPWATSEWLELHDAIAMAEDDGRGVCQTAGWIIHEAADYILVAGSLGLSFDDDRQVGDVFKLPRNCIREIVVLHSGRIVHGDAE